MQRLLSWFSNTIVKKWRNMNQIIQYIAIGVPVGLIATNLIYSQYKNYQTSQRISELEKQGAIKRNELKSTVHQCFQHYSSILQNDITKNIFSMSGMEIRSNIIKGNIDCKSVILIFSNNAHKINDTLRLNCILEEHYDVAYNEASKLDTLMQKKRDESKEAFEEFVTSKPLLGIPISLKDHYKLKNSDCTWGTLNHCNKKFEEDGEMVQLIRHFGGIPFVKTSCPQMNVIYETYNNIIGHTLHFLNNKRVVGGSSGGEGCLVGSGGSVLGIASDVAGSMRCPSDWCGVISLKPSSKRCLQVGSDGPHKGYWNDTTIMPSFGPIGRNMCDIVQFLKVYWSEHAFKLDPYMAQIKFRDEIYNSTKKIRIGYWFYDGWFMPTKSQRRAIELSVKALRHQENKYEIVAIDDYNLGFKTHELFYKCMAKENGFKDVIRALDGEPIYYGYESVLGFNKIPDWIKHTVIANMLKKSGDWKLEKLVRISTKYDQTAKEIAENTWEIQKFRYDFWKLMQNKYNVDLIITAVWPFPAPPIDFQEKCFPSTTYCILQNLLDCSAGSYSPICYVNKHECDYLNDDMLPEKDKNDTLSKAVHEFMKDAEGMPVGVQVFGKPFDDELVLRVMTELEQNFKNVRVANKNVRVANFKNVRDFVC